MRRAVIFGASALLASCSALADFNGLVGSPDTTDATIVDGASATTDSSVPVDAGSDATSIDANTDAMIPDASPDGPYCTTHPGHTFCDDFDETPLATNWSLAATNGTVALDTSTFISAPNSMKATGDVADGSATFGDTISRDFSAAATIAVHFDAKVEDVQGGCDFVFLSFDANPAAAYTSCYLDVSLKSTGDTVLEAYCAGGTAADFYNQATLSTSLTGWHQYAFTLDVKHATLSTSFDGNPGVMTSIPTGFAAGAISLGLGSNADGSCIANIDNVVVDSP